MPLKLIAAVAVLALPCGLAAQTPRIELQASAEHVLVNGDTPESARQFALIAAREQAERDVVSSLQRRGDLAALKLTPVQLAAYIAALIESDDSTITVASPSPSRLRVSLRASFPTADAVERLSALHKDEDAARAVVTAFMQSVRLSTLIAEQTGRRAPMSEKGAAEIVNEQLKAAASWKARRLIARGAAALARTEPSTIGGRTPSAEGRRRAKESADQAVALDPDSPEARTLLGDVYVDAEEPEAAEGEYRRALALGASSAAAARTKLAEALRLQGKFTEASAELQEAIRLDASFAQAHSDLGMILRAERKVPEALAEYREAIRLDPRSTDALNGLAITLAGAGQPEDAVTAFKAIVAIDPESTIGYYNLATVLANLDRDVEAAAALREVIRINPNHYNARFNLGELFRLEGKFDDSASQFREYLRLAPDTPQNRRNIERARKYVQQFTNE